MDDGRGARRPGVREFQALHVDVGVPTLAARAVPVAVFTALFVDPELPSSDPSTGRFSAMYHVDMVEVPSSSASASGAFFEQAFGWAPTAYGTDYVDVASAPVTLGFQSDASESPAAPLIVIRADDLDDARNAIERAGGVVTAEPFEFPGGSRFHFREPGGAELAVWRPTG